jgi:uncharacterized DUF497 family protein
VKFTLSDHAVHVISERRIDINDIMKVVEEPELVLDDKKDPTLEHRLKVIAHYNNRVLRVIINKTTDPIRIITAYYDRSMKGKI